MSTEILNSRLEGSHLIVETEDGSETYDPEFMVAALLIFCRARQRSNRARRVLTDHRSDRSQV